MRENYTIKFSSLLQTIVPYSKKAAHLNRGPLRMFRVIVQRTSVELRRISLNEIIDTPADQESSTRVNILNLRRKESLLKTI